MPFVERNEEKVFLVFLVVWKTLVCMFGKEATHKRLILKEVGIMTIDDIVRRLNDGLDRTEEELEMCKKWLLEYQLANDISLKELDDLCFEDSNWIFDNIFG